jgi:hypothetical protein
LDADYLGRLGRYAWLDGCHDGPSSRRSSPKFADGPTDAPLLATYLIVFVAALIVTMVVARSKTQGDR